MGFSSTRGLLSFILFFILLFNFVDGAIPQLEMALLNGQCPVQTGVIKLGLAAVFLFGGAVGGFRINAKSEIVFIVSIFLVYLALDTLFFVGVENFSVNTVLYSFENYYFYVLILPLAFSLRPKLIGFNYYYLMVFLVLTVGALGFFQGFLGEAILPTASTDGNFFVPADLFFSTTRAFSLFGNAGSFGIFLTISGAFLLAKLLYEKRILQNFQVVLLFCFVCATVPMTYARSVYYQFILALLAVYLIYKRRMVILRFLPLIYGIVGVTLAFMVSALNDIFGRTIFGVPIFDDTSTGLRFVEWAQVLRMITVNASSLFFGTSQIQTASYKNTVGALAVTIDNLYLAITLHIGLIGLVLYLLVMDRMWKHCLTMVSESRNLFSLACIATFCTWPIQAVFTIPLVLPLMFMFALVASGIYQSSQAQPAQSKPASPPRKALKLKF